MGYSVEAMHIVSQNDGNSIVVGFADDEFDTKKYVLLERSLDCDAQDIALGFDKVHIEVEDQVRSLYGGIDSISVAGQEIEITLTPKGKEALRIADELTIVLRCGEPEIKTVVEQLRNLANGEFLVDDNQ